MIRKLLAVAATLTIFAGILFSIPSAEASLWEYYQERGESLPSISERAELAAELAIWGYRGTAEQNHLLEKRLRETYPTAQGEEPLLGFSVSTRYKTTLQSTMSSTQATVPVSSIKTHDGTTLTINDLGGTVFLTVEPGTSREEIVKCTTISSSQWATCTRGLAFSGTSEASVAANRYTHRAGSVVIMSNTHYIFERLVDKSDSSVEYVEGRLVLTSSTPIYVGDGTDTGDKCYNFHTTAATSSPPRICWGESSQQIYVSNDGASSFVLTPTSTDAITYDRGLVSENSVLSVATSTTAHPGLNFIIEGSKPRLRVATSSVTGGNAINADATGLFLLASTTARSGLEFNGTTGALQWRPEVSEVRASSTVYAENLVAIGGVDGTDTTSTILHGNLDLRGNLGRNDLSIIEVTSPLDFNATSTSPFYHKTTNRIQQSGGSATTTVFSLNIPGGTLGPTGTILVDVWGIAGNVANDLEICLSWGGCNSTTIFSTKFNVVENFHQEYVLSNDGADNSQRYILSHVSGTPSYKTLTGSEATVTDSNLMLEIGVHGGSGEITVDHSNVQLLTP